MDRMDRQSDGFHMSEQEETDRDRHMGGRKGEEEEWEQLLHPSVWREMYVEKEEILLRSDGGGGVCHITVSQHAQCLWNLTPAARQH